MSFLIACDENGSSYQKLSGNESELPEELKGLKVYTIKTGVLDHVKVAILDNKINSTTYQVGNTQESTIIVNQNTGKAIIVSQILFENDSIVVARK